MKKLLIALIAALICAGCNHPKHKSVTNQALGICLSLKDERNELLKLTNYLLSGGEDTLAINIMRNNYNEKRKVSDSLIQVL